ncbi:hypothetical protein JOD20_001162 [Herpetosiphon giganteus]|nr:hypothetical protein [Herpetosiphon giganteus]
MRFIAMERLLISGMIIAKPIWLVNGICDCLTQSTSLTRVDFERLVGGGAFPHPQPPRPPKGGRGGASHAKSTMLSPSPAPRERGWGEGILTTCPCKKAPLPSNGRGALSMEFWII